MTFPNVAREGVVKNDKRYWNSNVEFRFLSVWAMKSSP